MARRASKKPAKSKRKVVKRTMTDKPLPFPRHAAEARDRSAEEAATIVREAEAGLEQTSDPNLLKRLGRILASANVILRLLEGQGAKTRPGERRVE
jgi:hypothetical protein